MEAERGRQIDDDMVKRATDAFVGRGRGDWKWEDGIRLALHAALDGAPDEGVPCDDAAIERAEAP